MEHPNMLGGVMPETKKPLSPKRKWGMLVVLSLALAIIILDTTILNVALSAIIRDLHTDIQSLQWVITAYSLTLASLTITGGRMGDIFGRKKMFVFGAVLFAIGSFIASVSTNIPMLIAGESIIEGIGAALMMPATASLLVANFVGRERAVAFGVWGGIAGAAAALGPILGGFLTTHYDWRWGFRVNLFVVLALIIGSILIPESHDTKEKPELDLVGVGLSATGLLAFVFGIIEASRYGWWHAKEVFTIGSHALAMPWDLSIVPFCVAIGAAIIAGFVKWEFVREANQRTPLVSMRLFRNRRFTSGIVTTCIMSLGQTGLVFALPVFLQSVRGLDAYQTGLSLLPMSLGLLIISPLAAMLGKKVAPKPMISFGLLVNVAAYLVLRQTLNVDTTSADMIPGLALFGVGMGLVMSQINNVTLSAVSVQEAGEASGLNNTLRQVGATLGSAIIGTVLIATLSANLADGVNASSVIPQPMKAAIADAIDKQTSNVEFGGGAQLNGNVPEAIKKEIVVISHEATVKANRMTLLIGAGFAFLGFLSSLFMPGTKKGAHAEEAASKPRAHGGATGERELDPMLIAELIQTDHARQARGLSGLGADVRAVIDASVDGGSILDTADPRFVQARNLWDAGWGKELGYQTFADYLASVPSAPLELTEVDAQFPYLILVDARVSVVAACQLLGIAPKGNDATPRMKHLHEKGDVYWMRCQQGLRYTTMSVAEAERNFASGEIGLTAVEGIALAVQMPRILQTRYVDLPRSTHEGFDNSSACLGTWNGRCELRWRWNDHADDRCRVATRRG